MSLTSVRPARYDLPKTREWFVADVTPEEIEQRLRDGEWLSPPLVAVLFDVDPNTVRARLNAGSVRFRPKSPGSRYRVCHPDDVLALLDESRRVHRAGDT